MIKEIKRIYPEHGILSEENGEMESNSGYKWIIDPIDGTKNFIRNYMTWGTLLALEHDSEVVLGIISLPAMKKLIVAAKGQGCFVNGKRAVVSGISRIKDSYCLYGGMGSILKKKYSNNFLDLVSRCYYSRGFGDCHGHSLVISGDAEIMVDPSTSPYDVAPIKICIEEAGGVFTDLKGNATIYGGNALTTNGKLHDKILSMLNR